MARNQSNPAFTEVVMEKCPCGFERSDRMIYASPIYSGWGVLGLFMGGLARPRMIEYMCIKCRQVIARTTDPEVLKRQS